MVDSRKTSEDYSKDKKPFTIAQKKHLDPIDFDNGFMEFKKKFDASLKMTDFVYLMYPKVLISIMRRSRNSEIFRRFLLVISFMA